MASTADTLPGAQSPTLHKSLGSFDAVTVLLAITIGAGIFSTPQEIATYLTSFRTIMFCWLLVGGFAFIGGLIHAEIGTRLPYTGGGYVYITRCFGPEVGFLYGWKGFLITNPSSRAGLALIGADYIGHFIPLNEVSRMAVALAALWFVGGVNYAGLRWAMIFQRISVAVKFTGLVALVVVGWIAVSGVGNLLGTAAPSTRDAGPIGGFTKALMLIYFAYSGYGMVGRVAGELREPRRAIPFGIFTGLAAVIVLYFLTNALYYRVLGIEGLRASDVVAADTAERLIGNWGGGLVALLVIFSVTGSMTASVMGCSRIYYAMARDGIFFRWFDQIHPKFRTPTRAIIAHLIVASLMLLARRNFEDLITSFVFMGLIFSVLRTASIFKLRRNNIGGENTYQVPFYPILPWIYILGLLSIIISRIIFDWDKAWFDLAILGAGIPAAYLWCRRIDRSKIDVIPWTPKSH